MFLQTLLFEFRNMVRKVWNLVFFNQNMVLYIWNMVLLVESIVHLLRVLHWLQYFH
jgi:hypothetical protein